jgi:hypothetical protein
MVRFDNGAFFDYKNSSSLGNSGTKMWSGFSTAVTITESGLFLRINDKNKLITGKTVYDKLEEFRRRSGNYRTEECMRAIKEYLKGKVVIAGYGNFRAYRIGDITFDRDVKNTEFELEKEGKKEKITVKDYYKRQYNIDIRHEDQPLIVEEIPRNKRDDENKIIRYLIPELCYFTGIDELNERDRAEIITKSKFQPAQKIQKIESGYKYLKNQDKKKS